MTRSLTSFTLLAAALTLAACGGQEQVAANPATETPAPVQAASNMGENLTPDPGGKIIVVQMMTDDEGNNRFEPAEIEAHPGDVVRYTLKSGVHNANFVPDSNSAKVGLPSSTPLLQLPGQTIDIKVTMAPGKYYFHCDPHALLGMKGWLEVEASN
jgi:plastocyanin